MAKPKIVIGETDHKKLTVLADSLMQRRPEVAQHLATELERAKVVKDGATGDTVQIGSVVEYEASGAATRRVTLVYPADADIESGKVSILTPIGTALLGLSSGQRIDYVSNDGKKHTLTVRSVSSPASA